MKKKWAHSRKVGWFFGLAKKKIYENLCKQHLWLERTQIIGYKYIFISRVLSYLNILDYLLIIMYTLIKTQN